MTRRRLPLEYVTGDSARKAIFTKRKRGLFKKADELSTLCGISVCFVIWSAFNPVPEVWPPSAAIVRGILTKYREAPEVERAKRRTSFEEYLKERVAKAVAQRAELVRDTREKEMTWLMNRCLSMDVTLSSLPRVELGSLRSSINTYATRLGKRIEMLKDTPSSSAGPTQPLDQPPTNTQITTLASNDDGSASDKAANAFWGDEVVNINDISNNVTRPSTSPR